MAGRVSGGGDSGRCAGLAGGGSRASDRGPGPWAASDYQKLLALPQESENSFRDSRDPSRSSPPLPSSSASRGTFLRVVQQTDDGVCGIFPRLTCDQRLTEQPLLKPYEMRGDLQARTGEGDDRFSQPGRLLVGCPGQ